MSTNLKIPGHTSDGVPESKDVTKKVRMTRDRAHRLAALAKKTGKSESEILREGLDVMERLQQQHEAIQALLDTLQPGEKYEKDRLIFK